LTDGISPRRYLTFIISKQVNQDKENWQLTVGTVSGSKRKAKIAPPFSIVFMIISVKGGAIIYLD
jgi:hypothetical protein